MNLDLFVASKSVLVLVWYCSRGRVLCDGIYLAMLGCIRQDISGSPRLAFQLSFARCHIKSRMLVF